MSRFLDDGHQLLHAFQVVDTGTPMGSMVFTVMAALAQMELDIKRE